MDSLCNATHMGSSLTIIKLVQGICSNDRFQEKNTERRDDWRIQMYTITLTLYIEKYPGDSNITGLVSEIHKHGLEQN